MTKGELVGIEGSLRLNRFTTKDGEVLKEGDFISVRGLGRIMYEETIAATKKGRYMVTVRKYI